jgi:hypothetical protein
VWTDKELYIGQHNAAVICILLDHQKIDHITLATYSVWGVLFTQQQSKHAMHTGFNTLVQSFTTPVHFSSCPTHPVRETRVHASARGHAKPAKIRLGHGTLGRNFIFAWSFGVVLLLVQLRALLPFQASASQGIAVLAASELNVVATALDSSAGHLWIGAMPDLAGVAASYGGNPSNLTDLKGMLDLKGKTDLKGKLDLKGMLDLKGKTDLTEKLRIAIVVTSDDTYAANYQWHTDSMRCYAAQHGYEYIRVPTRDMVTRHNVALQHFDKADWFLFLDGDSMVVNYARRVEEYVDPDVNLVLITRLINGEVCACGYLIRNSAWSRDFLGEWLGYRGGKVYNSDNGILLFILARRLLVTVPEGAERQAAETCVASFERGMAGYNQGKCCLWAIAGRQRKWPALGFRVLRRGHGFLRDDWMAEKMMDSDFIIHHKKRWEGKFVPLSSNPFVDKSGKCKHITGLVWPQFRISGEARRALVCEKDVRFANSGEANFAPDIALCHPNCSSEALEPQHFVPSVAFCLGNYKRPKYTNAICRDLPSANHTVRQVL